MNKETSSTNKTKSDEYWPFKVSKCSLSRSPVSILFWFDCPAVAIPVICVGSVVRLYYFVPRCTFGWLAHSGRPRLIFPPSCVVSWAAKQRKPVKNKVYHGRIVEYFFYKKDGSCFTGASYDKTSSKCGYYLIYVYFNSLGLNNT